MHFNLNHPGTDIKICVLELLLPETYYVENFSCSMVFLLLCFAVKKV